MHLRYNEERLTRSFQDLRRKKHAIIAVLVESYVYDQTIGLSPPLSSDHLFDFALASTIHTRLDYKNSYHSALSPPPRFHLCPKTPSFAPMSMPATLPRSLLPMHFPFGYSPEPWRTICASALSWSVKDLHIRTILL